MFYLLYLILIILWYCICKHSYTTYWINTRSYYRIQYYRICFVCFFVLQAYAKNIYIRQWYFSKLINTPFHFLKARYPRMHTNAHAEIHTNPNTYVKNIYAYIYASADVHQKHTSRQQCDTRFCQWKCKIELTETSIYCDCHWYSYILSSQMTANKVTHD